MDSHRAILLLSIVVAMLLPLSVLASGPYHQPYEDPAVAVEYAIAHESTDAFEETRLERSDSVPIRELSSETRRAFREMKDDPRDSRNGWREGDITVCDGRMLACDEYSARPDFRTATTDSVSDGHTSSFTVVLDDGERYVVRETQPYAPMHIAPVLHAVLTMVLFAAYGLVTSGFVRSRGESRPLLSVGFVGYGAALIAWPYLVLYTRLDGSPVRPAAAGLGLGLACWASLWGYRRYRAFSG